MPTEGFVRRGQRDMSVNPSVNDVAIHADYIRWLSWILHEHVLRRKIPVADLVYMVAVHRPNAGKNDSVANLLVLDHLLHPGEQIGVELEPKYQNPVKLAFDGINVGDLVAVGFSIFCGRWRRLHHFAASLLSCEDASECDKSNRCFHHELSQVSLADDY